MDHFSKSKISAGMIFIDSNLIIFKGKQSIEKVHSLLWYSLHFKIRIHLENTLKSYTFTFRGFKIRLKKDFKKHF